MMKMRRNIAGCILSLILMFGMVDLASALPIEVYNNNFESGIDSVWSSNAWRNNGDVGNYHGLFNLAEETTLTLTGLSAHTQLSLEFDLYLFDTWDGNNTTYGPDYFSLSGDVSGSWTFTNHQPEGQSYPGSPDEIYGSGMWATHVYRGLDPTGTGDEFLVSHSGSVFSVTFGGPTSHDPDETWGIDNVRVSINGNGAEPVPEPATIALFGIGLAGYGGRYLRKKFKKTINSKC